MRRFHDIDALHAALRKAVAEGNVPAVRWLIARGADPTIRGPIDGETAIEIAERKGLIVIVDLLRAPAL